MPDLATHHLLAIVAIVVCLLCIGLLAHRLDQRAARRRATADDIRDAARREHFERLARLRNWPKPPRPLHGHRPGNPGPGLRPHPVYGTETRRPWVIPPADLPDPRDPREPDTSIQICTLPDVADTPTQPEHTSCR